MIPLQIKRRRDTNVDPKQSLRGYVDQLPLDQQHEFVLLALQLITLRPSLQARDFVPVIVAPSSARR